MTEDLNWMMAPKQPLIRTPWNANFEWDMEIELANKEVFGNEFFREN